MTLLEFLNTLDPQELVFVGSGSAWFDIARAGQMRKDGYLSDLDKKEMEKLCKSRDGYNLNLLRFSQSGVTIPNVKFSMTRGSEVQTFIEALSACAKRAEHELDEYIEADNMVTGYVPLAERKVLETYPRICEKGTCIVISGTEKGSYWLVEEKYKDGIVPPWNEEECQKDE